MRYIFLILYIFTVWNVNHFLTSAIGPPATVRIGGLMRMFTPTNTKDVTGIQYLYAFLMAIDEINRDSSILPNTQIRIAVRYPRRSFLLAVNSAIYLANNAFNNTGVQGCVGPTSLQSSKAAAQIFAQYPVVNINWNSDSELSLKSNYPYFTRTVPADSFQAVAIADIIGMYFKWKKVVVFSSDDFFGSGSLFEFTKRAIELQISILSSQVFKQGAVDFTDVITSAKSSGGSIFVLLTGPSDAALLLQQGYSAGLFVEGTQVIGSSFASLPLMWQALPSLPLAASIMKGFIGVIPSIDMSTPVIKGFMTRWRAQKPTIFFGANGKSFCSNKTDDDGGVFLYEGNPDGTKNTPLTCTGLVFSSFPADGSTMDNSTFYVYDATYALARAMHQVLYVEGKTSFNGNDIMRVILNNVSFRGVTGNISFSQGYGGHESYAQGDRRTDAFYRIINYHVCYNNVTGVDYPCQKTIGTLNTDTGFKACDPTYFGDCDAVQYNTKDNSKPLDWPNPIEVQLDIWMKYLLWALSAICFSLIALCLCFTIYYRKKRLIKSSQPIMLFFILFGESLGTAMIFTSEFKVTVTTCVAEQWIGHMSFWTVFGSLFIKTWRVHRLLNSKFKRRKISVRFIGAVMTALIYMVGLYLILSTLFASPKVKFLQQQDGNQTYLYPQCKSSNAAVTFILYGIEAFAMVVGAGLCWATRNVQDEYHEATYIAICMYIVSIIIHLHVTYFIFVGQRCMSLYWLLSSCFLLFISWGWILVQQSYLRA